MEFEVESRNNNVMFPVAYKLPRRERRQEKAGRACAAH